MKRLLSYLQNSYTAYHAVENAKTLLLERGFTPLSEREPWHLKEGGKYFVTRNASSLIAFTVGEGNGFKLIASHTDSPCFQVKENPVAEENGYQKLNVEPYGGSLYYSFFDRPLRLAGRLIKEKGGELVTELYTSEYNLVIPSLAIHQNREANEKFAPNAQVDLMPLLSLGDKKALFEDCVSYDVFLSCDETPFVNGANGEFISAPRIDNLTSVLASLTALDGAKNGVCVAACLNNEEVGSATYQGAGSNFLAQTVNRIASAKGMNDEALTSALCSSLMISLDNAHAVHPNHPEKSDPTNKCRPGGGVAIKNHAGKAYATDALTSALIKSLFNKAGVPYQSFYNRSDVRSGGTLGAISLGQLSVPCVDLGLCQLAMHSAVETFAYGDYLALIKGLTAFYASDVTVTDQGGKIN